MKLSKYRSGIVTGRAESQGRREKARLQWSSIRRTVRAFPKSPAWHMKSLEPLCKKHAGRFDWSTFRTDLADKGGIYAFLLPRLLLRHRHARDLGDGLMFDFPARGLCPIRPYPTLFVVYVGRTDDLLARLQFHVHGHSMSSKLLDRLAKTLGGRKKHARAVLLRKGKLVYCIMDGDAATADRHCVEDWLCGTLGPPLNIQREHWLARQGSSSWIPIFAAMGDFLRLKAAQRKGRRGAER